MKKLLKMSLDEIYLDYINNFQTIGAMAEYYQVEYNLMFKIYECSRDLYCTIYYLK